jgi:HAD superfamily hydrolase (TIGR01484 family)
MSGDDVKERFADTKISKFCLYPVSDGDETFLQTLSDRYSTIKCNGYWEIIPHGFDKGRGVQLTEELLGLDPAESVAVGDSANDVKMFEYVPFSVAMGNANDDIKAMCDMVTDDVRNDGVAKMIYKLLK